MKIKNRYYAIKVINSSLYGRLGLEPISIISKKRKNKIIRIFDVDMKQEDETIGLIYAPYLLKYEVGIEPAYNNYTIKMPGGPANN